MTWPPEIAFDIPAMYQDALIAATLDGEHIFTMRNGTQLAITSYTCNGLDRSMRATFRVIEYVQSDFNGAAPRLQLPGI